MESMEISLKDITRPGGKLMRGWWFLCPECGHASKGPSRRKGMVHFINKLMRACPGEHKPAYFVGNPNGDKWMRKGKKVIRRLLLPDIRV